MLPFTERQGDGSIYGAKGALSRSRPLDRCTYPGPGRFLLYTEEKAVEFQLGGIEAASAGLKQLIPARGGVRCSLRNRPMDRAYLNSNPKMLTTDSGHTGKARFANSAHLGFVDSIKVRRPIYIPHPDKLTEPNCPRGYVFAPSYTELLLCPPPRVKWGRRTQIKPRSTGDCSQPRRRQDNHRSPDWKDTPFC